MAVRSFITVAKISRDRSIPPTESSGDSSANQLADARLHPQISPTRLFSFLPYRATPATQQGGNFGSSECAKTRKCLIVVHIVALAPVKCSVAQHQTTSHGPPTPSTAGQEDCPTCYPGISL